MEDLKITVCFNTASEDELDLDEERLFDTQPDTSMRKWQQSHTITSANKRQNLSISPEAAAISNNIDLVQTDKKIVYKPLQFPKRKQETTQPPATSRLILNSRGTKEKLLDRSTSNEHLTPETVTSNDLVQIEKKIIYRTLQLPKKRQEITKTPTVSRLILNAGAVTGTKEQQKHLERSKSKQHLAAINFDLVQADEKLVIPKKRQEIIKTPTILRLSRVTKEEHQHQERSTSKEHLVTKDFQTDFQTDERPVYKTVIQKKKIETATKTQTVSRLIYNDKQHTSGRATKDVEDRRSRSINEEHIYSEIDTSNEFDLIQSEDDEHEIPDYSNRVEKKKYPPTSTVSRLIYNDKHVGASTSKKTLKDADLKLSDDEGKSMKLKSAVRVINNKTAVRAISKKTDVREISNNKIVREISNTSAYHEIKKSSETHRSKEFNEDKSPNSGFQKLMDIEVDIVDVPLPHKRRKESSKSQEYSEDEEHEYSSSKRKRYTSSQNQSDSSSSEQHEYFKRNKPEYSKSKLSERTSTKKRNSSSSQERDYIKSSKPDYSKSKNPEYSNSKKQEYSSDEEREYLKNKKPEYSNERRHSQNSKPQYSSTKKQEYSSDEEREHFNRNKPEYSKSKKPEYSKNKKPAETFSRRKQSEERVYFKRNKPEYSNSRKPEFSNHRNQSTSRNPENSNYRKNEHSNNANPGCSCSCKNNQNTNNNRDNGFPGFKNREFNKFSGNIRGNMGGGGGSRFNNNPKAGSSFSANRNNNNNNNNISNEYFGKVDLDLLRTDNNLLRRDNERLQRELEILQKKLEEKK